MGEVLYIASKRIEAITTSLARIASKGGRSYSGEGQVSSSLIVINSLWQYSRGKESDSLPQSNDRENRDNAQLFDGKDEKASSGIDISFNNTLTEIARQEGVGLNKDTRIALFIGGPHIRGGYYYKLFEDVIRKRLGINLVYLPFVIEEGKTAANQLSLVTEQLRSNSRLVGAVITRPWKQGFFDVDGIEINAQLRRIGAFNYIVKNLSSKKLQAFATDGRAWIDGLNRDMNAEYDFSNKKVVILGAEGLPEN